MFRHTLGQQPGHKRRACKDTGAEDERGEPASAGRQILVKERLRNGEGRPCLTKLGLKTVDDLEVWWRRWMILIKEKALTCLLLLRRETG